MAFYTGTTGNDTRVGTANNDTFNMVQGGVDRIDGGDGDDTVLMGANLRGNDRIVGGGGFDTVVLQGDYSSGLTFNASTMTGVETVDLEGGFSYNLTFLDAANTFAAGIYLRVDGTGLGAGDALTVDGSAETASSFHVAGGQGDDVLTGGAGGDIFDLTRGGADHADGGDGINFFLFGAAFTADDRVVGGAGLDVASFKGDYGNGLMLDGTSFDGVERFDFEADHDYAVTIEPDLVAEGSSVTFFGEQLGIRDALSFDGSAESRCTLTVLGGESGDDLIGGSCGDFLYGGDGADQLMGGKGADEIWGGYGRDTLSGGKGADTFVYNATGESAAGGYDTIQDLKTRDTIDLSRIDADGDSANGDTAFVLVSNLTGVAGEASLRYSAADDMTRLRMDTDGDGHADAMILIAGDRSGYSGLVL